MTTLHTPTEKKGMFVINGQNLIVTFLLVSSLFFIWAFCNGMIDTMDKHFQDQLNLSKAQSAWVQFAHYMGYALMALPAGLITRKIGYKGGIIFGLMLVAVGGFWFMPATSINQFWAFLLGVCVIAMGLTVLETVANPYTTVLGPKQYGAARINLAQSCNGVGWLIAPFAGSYYFYSEGGVEKAQGQLFIPYLGVGIVVLVVAVMFFFAPVPDIKTEDEYHTDEGQPVADAPVTGQKNRGLILLMIFLNVAALGLSLYLILNTILTGLEKVDEATMQRVAAPIIAGVVVLATLALLPFARRVTSHSIWAHPHFSGATIAQFLYVAAQAGIFSFFINSMTVDKSNGYCMVPPIPQEWKTGFLANHNCVEVRTAFAPDEIKDFAALATWIKTKPDAVATFVNDQLQPKAKAQFDEYKPGTAPDDRLTKTIVAELNHIIRQEINKKDAKPPLYDDARFHGVTIDPKAKELTTVTERNDHQILRLNRLLLADALPSVLPFHDSILSISDQGAGYLSSIAFACFLLGRISGSFLLRTFSAHKTLGLYAFINIGVCGLIIGQLGWLSVISVFLSYFFMSIMFPTIFAVGIYGLGSQSKKKASAFIVMSITGGALMPKFMGHLGDVYNMSAAFWIPLACFVLIATYSFSWPILSGHKSLQGLKTTGGH